MLASDRHSAIRQWRIADIVGVLKVEGYSRAGEQDWDRLKKSFADHGNRSVPVGREPRTSLNTTGQNNTGVGKRL